MDPTEVANRIRALTSRTERHDDDPTVIAERLGIEVLAVDRMWLAGDRGEYSRVDDVGRIYVDERLRGATFAAVVAHELGHALCDSLAIATSDEEKWCDAFGRILVWRARRLFAVPVRHNAEIVHSSAQCEDLGPLELAAISVDAPT